MKPGPIRILLIFLGLSIVPAAAQTTAKPVTVGILMAAKAADQVGPPTALIERVRDLGYEEGRNLNIEFRYGDGTKESLPKLAAELVSLKPDVIVAASTPAVIAAKNATTTIPIVMTGAGNPVETGLVQSLAHPGGNVTGRSNTAGGAEIGQKLLQLITETFPGICCVSLLFNPASVANVANFPASISAAKSLGVEIKVIEATNPEQLNQVLSAPPDARFARAMQMTADVMFWAHRAEIAEAALRHGTALFAPFRENAQAGALMSYGVDNDDEWRAVAVYVDKILKGAKPAGLPVEQPTRFRLVINMKAAKALGLTIPPAVLGRADEVIE